MNADCEEPKFCGNLLIRRTNRRSFLNKSTFDGMFGVLTEHSFEYYKSSVPWTKKEKPAFFIRVVDIQGVEEVDQTAFNRSLCFQIYYQSQSKTDKRTRTVHLCAHDEDELKSWLVSLRSVCVENPIWRSHFHAGRYNGKSWTCCSATKLSQSPGCRPCTILGLFEDRKQRIQLSPPTTFKGFGVIADESYSSDRPESLPFQEGDHLTIADASGKHEWQAFLATSTSGFGIVPTSYLTLKDYKQEPWYFGEIPTSLTNAVLREQPCGCFILRKKSNCGNILSFRTETSIKHVEILFNEDTQKYRLMDTSDPINYANFLQFESIQQLMDQCKQHSGMFNFSSSRRVNWLRPLGLIIDKFPSRKNVEELWKIDWQNFEQGDEIETTLPWALLTGKFNNKPAVVHLLKESTSDLLKEQFNNQARIMMILNHENLVTLYGIGTGTKWVHNFIAHEYLSKGNLREYLIRNASLLVQHPTELESIISQLTSGMVYLEEKKVIHNELVAENCMVGNNGLIKIAGFHCSRSPWCQSPLTSEVYSSKIAIEAPELSTQPPTIKSDVWAFGLLVCVIITAAQRQFSTIEEVLSIDLIIDNNEQLSRYQDVVVSSVNIDPEKRPYFHQIRDLVATPRTGPSTPSASSVEFSFNGTLSPSTSMNGETLQSNAYDLAPDERGSNASLDLAVDYQWDEITDIKMKDDKGDLENTLHERLRKAELEALKAKALQKKAEAQKEQILIQIQQAEAKCLREVELMTKTFLARLNEANERVHEAQETRYLAEEMKRITDEKFTLYKYETERNVHDLKQILDETMIERDELLAALKSVGKDFDCQQEIKKERSSSIKELEEKYEKYMTTSDKTIQSLKEQLNDVVTQRDQLVDERDVERAESKELRNNLDKAVKENLALQFKLEEVSYEVERLEETISASSQRQEQVERERDQLQLLTEMSLMKLQQSETPKKSERKRHSISTIGSFKENVERSDKNLQELSDQLRDLLSPAAKHREKNLNEAINEVTKFPSSEVAKQYEETTKQYRNRTRKKSSKARQLPILPASSCTSRGKPDQAITTCPVAAFEVQSEERPPSSSSRFISIKYMDLGRSNKSTCKHYTAQAPVKDVIQTQPDDTTRVAWQEVQIKPKAGVSPTSDVPKIAISLVDDCENVRTEEGNISYEEQVSSLPEGGQEELDYEICYEIDFPDCEPRTSL